MTWLSGLFANLLRYSGAFCFDAVSADPEEMLCLAFAPENHAFLLRFPDSTERTTQIRVPQDFANP